MLSKGETYMLKSCNRCGKIHDFNKTCYKNRQIRGKTKADEFRKTNKWHQKSLYIRERDKNLCRCCIADIFNTQHIFNFNKLEVHHITPLEEDFDRRLDDDNLITLCCYHHKLAENNIIPRYILEKLTAPECNLLEIRQDVEGITIPPTF